MFSIDRGKSGVGIFLISICHIVWNILEIYVIFILQPCAPIIFTKHGVSLFAKIVVVVEIYKRNKSVDSIIKFLLFLSFEEIDGINYILANHFGVSVKFLQTLSA